MGVKKKPIYIKLGDTIVDYSNKFSDDVIFQKDSYESEEEEIEHACQRWCCTKGCLPGNTLKDIKDKWIKIRK